MSAAQQVFDTNELLEIIICHVDPHQMSELKLVNKTWRDTLKCKAVQRERVVLSHESNDPYTTLDLTKLGSISFASAIQDAFLCRHLTTTKYRSTDWLRINPVFKLVHTETVKDNNTNTQSYNVIIRLPSSTFIPTQRHAEELATDPPCSNITLARMVWDKNLKAWCLPENHQHCWAHDYTGLRVRDLLAVRDRMNVSEASATRTFNDGAEVVATFTVASLGAGEGDEFDRMMDHKYFDGPLPRYSKVSHKGDVEGNEARVKDQALMWSPS